MKNINKKEKKIEKDKRKKMYRIKRAFRTN